MQSPGHAECQVRATPPWGLGACSRASRQQPECCRRDAPLSSSKPHLPSQQADAGPHSAATASCAATSKKVRGRKGGEPGPAGQKPKQFCRAVRSDHTMLSCNLTGKLWEGDGFRWTSLRRQVFMQLLLPRCWDNFGNLICRKATGGNVVVNPDKRVTEPPDKPTAAWDLSLARVPALLATHICGRHVCRQAARGRGGEPGQAGDGAAGQADGGMGSGATAAGGRRRQPQAGGARPRLPAQAGECCPRKRFFEMTRF